MQVSLRRRFLATMLLLFSVAWVGAAMWAYINSLLETEELLDAELRHTATVVMGMSLHELQEEMLARSSSTLDINKHEEIRAGVNAKVAFQVWLANGQLALRTQSAPQTRLSGATSEFNDSSVNGEPWRVYALVDAETGITVLVGEHDSVRQELSGETAFRMVLPLIVVLPLIGISTWFSVGRVLTPLSRLAEQVARRRPEDFSAIDISNAPREAEPLIDALNRMFTRLQLSFENTRRFTADAAHELGTPLGAVAVQTDVAMLATDEVVRLKALDYVKRSTRNMIRMVQQLLTQAQWDAELADLHRTPLDLMAAVKGVVSEVEESARSRDIAVHVTATANPMPVGDEAAIHVIVRNLLDNAIRYTPVGGRVRVEIDATAGFAVLRVIDSGPGIAPELRERLFQRFYRAGRNDREGSGLGLSIVLRCIELHHGSVDVAEPEGGGLAVTVHLPL